MNTAINPSPNVAAMTDYLSFPDLSDPLNPYFKAVKDQKTKLTNFYANFTTDLKQHAEDRAYEDHTMRERQNGIGLFQRQCHQTLKNLHIVQKMLQPRLPNHAQIRAHINQLVGEFNELQNEYTGLRQKFRAQSSCLEDCRNIVNEWDSGRFLLTEVYHAFELLQTKSPLILHLFFNCKTILEQDVKLRAQLGIPLSTHSNGTMPRDVMLTPSKLSQHKRLSTTTTNSHPQSQLQDTQFDPYSIENGLYQPNEEDLTFQLSPEQIQLYALDTIEKRQQVQKDQEYALNQYQREYHVLEQKCQQKMYEKQQKLQRIAVLREQIRIGQQQSASYLGSSITTQTTSNSTSLQQQQQQQQQQQHQQQQQRGAIRGARGNVQNGQNVQNTQNIQTGSTKNTNSISGTKLINQNDPKSSASSKNDNNKITNQQIKPAQTQTQAQAQTTLAHPHSHPSTEITKQEILHQLQSQLHEYRAITSKLQFFNHQDVDLSGLYHGNCISFKLKAIIATNGKSTPSARLQIFRVPAGSTIPIQLQNSLINGPQGAGTNHINTPSVSIVQQNSFLILDAKLYLYEQEYTDKIRHLIKEAVQMQNLGQFVMEVQALLYETQL